MGVAGDSHLDKHDRKAVRRNGQASAGSVWRGYINVSLDSARKEEFVTWLTTDDPWEALAECVSSGCQVSLKYVGAEGVFLASATQRNADHVNAGLCVTARAQTADKALMRVLFLYRVLGSDGSWEAVQPVADPDRW